VNILFFDWEACSILLFEDILESSALLHLLLMNDLYSSKVMYRIIVVAVAIVFTHGVLMNQPGTFYFWARIITATSFYLHRRRFVRCCGCHFADIKYSLIPYSAIEIGTVVLSGN
jgi:hypothetical protein